MHRDIKNLSCNTSTCNDNYPDLSEVCLSMDVSVTESQSVEVSEQGNQVSNQRVGNVTVSRMHKVCHISIDAPSTSLIKTICYLRAISFSSKARRP